MFTIDTYTNGHTCFNTKNVNKHQAFTFLTVHKASTGVNLSVKESYGATDIHAYITLVERCQDISSISHRANAAENYAYIVGGSTRLNRYASKERLRGGLKIGRYIYGYRMQASTGSASPTCSGTVTYKLMRSDGTLVTIGSVTNNILFSNFTEQTTQEGDRLIIEITQSGYISNANCNHYASSQLVEFIRYMYITIR